MGSCWTPKIIVYALLDEQNRVVDINSSVFLPDVGGWARIDEGAGDRYTHAYNHYLPGRPLDVDGIPLYKWDGTQVLERTQEEIEADRAAFVSIDDVRAAKEAEISAACSAAIVAGMDVETSMGTEHFSLQETDQINLTTATNAVQTGAAGYPYHADGSLCRMFSAEEIMAIAQASINHKLYHTTLCNHLLTWARRAETLEEIKSITYSADDLPEDLAANMANIFTAAAASCKA